MVRRVSLAGLAFATAFGGCVFVVPAVGLALGVLLAPVGLGVLAAVIALPAHMLLLGDLRVGDGDARNITGADGYHAIPMVVWLATWAAFAWAARGLRWWPKVLSAVAVILAVTALMHLGLAVLGIRLCMVWW